MMRTRSAALGLAVLATVLGTGVAWGADEAIKNPYHKSATWKLWYRDPAPVPSKQLLKPGQVDEVAPTPEAERLYPEDVDLKDPKLKPGTLTAWRKGDWPERKYAGMWDDVYMAMDDNGTNPPTPHSWMPNVFGWGSFGHGVPALDGKFMTVYAPSLWGRCIETFGVNFTSQSTTGMGDDIANNGAYVGHLERDFYFSNALRAGPAANGAVADSNFFEVQDRYQALVPCFWNSNGQSSSEVKALGKMMMAGAHLPKELKPELKRNGLYMPTLLYIWKASMTYDASYDSEMRHRVAYTSNGGDFAYVLNRAYYLYDDTKHLQNMLEMAKGMKVAPPISLIKKVELAGGTEKYFHKTAALIHQKAGETVKVRVSTADCFDLAGKPLTFRWKMLHGNPKTTIVREGTSDTYLITVPAEPKMPKGRTSIILVANNGVYDSNPACVNIYRPDGEPNKKPQIEPIADQLILPGEKASFEVKAADPEGFPVTLYRRSGEVGTLTGTGFAWDCPLAQADGAYPVAIIASDGTGAINSQEVTIKVTSTRAKIDADKLAGAGPLTVKFSGKASSDKQKNTLEYLWDFNDGTTSTEVEPTHTFKEPGNYQVKLTVKGALGSHTEQVVVTAAHAWPLAIDNGWKAELDTAAWKTEGLAKGFAVAKPEFLTLQRPKDNKDVLETAKTFEPPFYVEAEFKKAWATKEEGFNVLGCMVGWGNGTNLPVGIRNLATDKKAEVGNYLSGDGGTEKSTLRMYVTADAAHPGKARYTGYWEALQGKTYFSFDDQAVTPGTLKVICTFARFELYRFQVWAPAAK